MVCMINDPCFINFSAKGSKNTSTDRSGVVIITSAAVIMIAVCSSPSFFGGGEGGCFLFLFFQLFVVVENQVAPPLKQIDGFLFCC